MILTSSMDQGGEGQSCIAAVKADLVNRCVGVSGGVARHLLFSASLGSLRFVFVHLSHTNK